MTIAIIVSFLLPFIWSLYFNSKDKNKEPAFWLFVSFVAGIYAAFLSFLAQSIFIRLFSQLLADHYLYFLNAFIEEFFKFLVVFLLVFPQKIFDEPVDSMIYMIFCAFGFAFIENFFILISPETQGRVLLISFYRFLGANFLHILASALIGYGYGLSMLTKKFGPLVFSFLSATFLHFIFNFVIIKTNIGFLYVLPLLWAIFLVVLSELNYLILTNERGNTKTS